jgi:hypothetical protein
MRDALPNRETVSQVSFGVAAGQLLSVITASAIDVVSIDSRMGAPAPPARGRRYRPIGLPDRLVVAADVCVSLGSLGKPAAA